MKKEEITLIILLVITIGILIITSFDNSLRTITGFVGLDNQANNTKVTSYIEGELIIKYKDNVIGNGNEIIINNGTKILVYEYLEKPVSIEKIIPDTELYNLKFDDDIENIINDYKNIAEIEYVEPNYLFEVLVIPDDSNYNQQDGLKNIIAEEAWNLTVGDKKVIIAFIDTGVEWTHGDLFNNIWNNSDEGCDENFDLDNNSYKGDCRGYDFVDVKSRCNNSDCNDKDNNPLDDHGHGTHVTGIASASSNNNLGVAGVCWNCSIMPIRAGYKDNSGIGTLRLDGVIQALHYAADNNATIISMSFGGSHSSALQDAINYSYNKSILIASAGNSGSRSKQYPCGYDNVICVSAIDSNNKSASYSNYGDWIDIAAPGSSILSTYLNHSYLSQSGTSMSVPLVSGSIGLIKSIFNKNQTEILIALTSTGDPTDFNGININKINIYKAILSLDDRKPNVTLIYPENDKINLTLNQTFSCEAEDWQLKNITLQIWNSTGDLFYNEAGDISGIFNKSNFNVNLIQDSYKWSCLVYDNKNNYNYGNSFTFSTINFTINLISPENFAYKNTKEINFNCSVQTNLNKPLANITFKLSNEIGLIYVQTKELTGILNSTTFSYNLSEENRYYWYCEAYNNETELATTTNFTITYDITTPKIDLLNPENSKSYNTNNQEVTFGFNVNDLSEIDHCNLNINNKANLTNNSIDKVLSQEFKSTFTPGNYEWDIFCVDKANNIGNSETRSFIVKGGSEEEKSRETSESISSGDDNEIVSEGGGEEAGVEIEKPKKTFFISNEQFSNGYTKELNNKDEIKFLFEDEKTFEHSLIINDIGKDYADITIQSNPINLKLGIGEEKKLNLTTSTNYDFYVKLNYINNNKANITIRLINEEISKETNENSEDKSGITGKSVEDTKDFSIKDKVKKYWIISLVIIVIIIIIIFYLKRKKSEK